jgi:hypothetical protein
MIVITARVSDPHDAGKIVARDSAVYDVDVWARSRCSVQVEDLTRLPQKMEELPWAD